MSFHLQQKLQQNNKRKTHDNNMKAKKLCKLSVKQIQQQIRATLTKEFEQKYAEKEKHLQQMQYKLELKQKWNNENMLALNHKPLNRADKDLFLQVRSITRDEIFPKIKFVTNQDQLDEYEKPGSLGYYFIEYCKTNCAISMVDMNDGEFWHHIKNVVYKTLGAKRNAIQSSLKDKFIELYKSNDTGLTKQNVLEMRNGNSIQKDENKYGGFFYFLHHFGPSIAGKKRFDKKQQCSVLFSDICTVSDEAFGRLTIERCWDTWTKECEQKQIQPNVKNLSTYTTNKTNKRFGGWSSAGMKRYDDIAKLVKSDRTFNHQVESLFKDLMFTNTYKNEMPHIAQPQQVLSDIHSSLGNEYVPYNEFMIESTQALSTKHMISNTNTNDKHSITPDKYISADSISSKPDIIEVFQKQNKVQTLSEMEQQYLTQTNIAQQYSYAGSSRTSSDKTIAYDFNAESNVDSECEEAQDPFQLVSSSFEEEDSDAEEEDDDS